MKGNIDSIKKFAEQSKFEELDKMIVHGADIAGYRDKDNWKIFWTRNQKVGANPPVGSERSPE